jgi:HSP20 family protein
MNIVVKGDRHMATVVRWEPFRELAALQSEMSRFMNGPAEGDGRTMQSWIPTADVWETEDEVVYAFDLPGVPEDKISIELDDGALTVTAEREREHAVEDGRFARFERRYGTFSRTIGVPQGVSEDDVKATYEQGVLTVHVGKPEQPKPRKIQIGLGSPEQKTTEQKTIEGTATRT